MFKIESYVTPILLSYVDKYVRDFKPADAQVSLWGGGVVLHNLVLKPDVLQQELALPFTLVSGRIHELLIQVPWTKIMSEPIVVTIDTIECILSLTQPATAVSEEELLQELPSRKTQVVEAPPGYMQALVRRIVSNIALRVHHLIVKYVQDDIVMSLNVKHLAVDSAGSDWAPCFADIDQGDPVIRRLMRLDNLTLCLDQADADGKIRFYQEPLLYRCQLDLRVLTRLVSATRRRASSLSIELRSSKLAWGVTGDQLTLLLRLVRERPGLVRRSPTPAPRPSASQTVPLHATSVNSAEPARSESWSEWAWSWLPTWSDRDGGLEEASMPPLPVPVHLAAYFDDVSFVFKVMETDSSRKRSRAVLELNASRTVLKSSICSPVMIRVRGGVRSLALLSRGKCVCAHMGYDGAMDEPTFYLRKKQTDGPEDDWEWPNDQLSQAEDSARDGDEGNKVAPDLQDQPDYGQPEEPAPDPKVPKDDPDEFWQKMAPQVYIEYIHERSPPNANTNPYDKPPIDFQYSDWVEECDMKIQFEPVEVRVCMGLLHRLMSLRDIFADLPHVADPELPMRTLTVEECEALSDNLPQQRITIEARGFNVQVHPYDHSMAERPSPSPLVLDLDLPKISVAITGPLYPHRVCSAACQMPDDSGTLWQGARHHVTLGVDTVQAKIRSTFANEARPCARADIRAVAHVLLNKDYFTRRESVVLGYSVQIREVNVCGSAARLQAAWQVLASLLERRASAALGASTLAADALHDEEAVAIDLTFEGLAARGYLTKNTNTHIVNLQSTKATALQEGNGGGLKQAWLFSAPDTPANTACLRLAVQWCKEALASSLDYAGVWTEPVAIAVDPLLIAWLAYKPALKPLDSTVSMTALKGISSQYLLHRRTPTSSSGRGASRSGSGAEVHARARSAGSSDKIGRDAQRTTKQELSPLERLWSSTSLITMHERIRRMVLNVELGLTMLYVTTTTASAVDCATVRDAMERHASVSQDVLALSLGRLTMLSNSLTKQFWQEVNHDGPTFLPSKAGQDPNQPQSLPNSFPWKFRIGDVSCYTLEGAASSERRRDSSASGLRSQLKAACVATPRTVLEVVTMTVTLSVVTKSLHIVKRAPKKETKKEKEPTFEEARLKYFTKGMNFKPTTLKEFVRGPAKRKKSRSPEPVKTEPGPDTVTTGPVVSLGIHIHADTPPLIIRLEQDQVHVIAAALHCFTHVLALHQRPALNTRRRSSTSMALGTPRSFIRSASQMDDLNSSSEDATSESKSELISIFEARPVLDSLKIKTFFWFQWVVSRVTVVAATDQLKLTFDVDDIISTVDVQTQYNQLKIMVASASVRHYTRSGSDEWTAGVLGGRVLEAREPSNAQEENHFLTITVTQARISNLPASWREELHPKLLEDKNMSDTMWEIYATLAPLEVIIQPQILEKVVSLVLEMAPRSFCPLAKEAKNYTPSNWQRPFLYITAGGLRLLLSVEGDDRNADDTFMFVIGKLSVNPHPDNPMCRRAVNVCDLNIEGRQYEVTIKNVAIRSAQLQQLVSQESSDAEMMKGTARENPALKWTQQVVSPSITPVLHAVDIGCVIAPALYLNGVLTYGPAVEFNLASDCAIELSLDQLAMAQRVSDNIMNAMKKSENEPLLFHEAEHGVCPFATLLLSPERDNVNPTPPSAVSPASVIDDKLKDKTDLRRSVGTDSGVDTATTSTAKQQGRQADEKSPLASTKKSVSVAFTEQETDESEFLEVFVTMGVIELSLYVADDGSPDIVALRPPDSWVQRAPPDPPTKVVIKEEQISSSGSHHTPPLQTHSAISLTECIRNADIGKIKLEQNNVFPHARKTEGNLPLLHITLLQPNLYYWRKKTQKHIQVSLFNAWVGLGAGETQDLWHAVLLSTAKGAVDPVTDIPPALATIKVVVPCSAPTAGGPPPVRGTLRLDVERPVMVELTADRLQRLMRISTLINSRMLSTKDDYPVHKRPSPRDSPLLYSLRRFLEQQCMESITVQTTQIGVSGPTVAAGLDAATLQLAVGGRPERLAARALLSALVASAGAPGGSRHVVLQPLMLGVELEASWEAWRRAEGGMAARQPSVRICCDLDSVTLDLRPEDLAAVVGVADTLEQLFSPDNSAAESVSNKEPVDMSTSSLLISQESALEHQLSHNSVEDDEQFYKDDLRSGAFKIVSSGLLPMAYQVTLHNNAVSWRYPHPRAITRLLTYPLPGQDEETTCVLEAFNQLLWRWEPHTHFCVPVGEPRELQLYVPSPDAVFAVMWRFRVFEGSEREHPFAFDINKFMPRPDLLDSEPEAEPTLRKAACGVTPEQLSGVVRVDSCFAPRLTPPLRIATRLARLTIHFHNELPIVSSESQSLEGYYLSKALWRAHRVVSLQAVDATLHSHLGSPAGALLLLDTSVSSDIIDCATGTMEELIEEFRLRAGVSLPNAAKSRARVAMSRVHVALDIPRLRTLQALAEDWQAAVQLHIRKIQKSSNAPVSSTFDNDAEVLAERLAGRVSLWLHNDTGSALRLGQDGTEEVVPFAPGLRLAYRWQSPAASKKLRFALAGSDLSCKWSNSIPLTTEHYRVRLHDAESLGGSKNSPAGGVFLYTRVEEVGGWRCLHVSGRLRLANMLRYSLLYKVRGRCPDSSQWRTVNAGELEAEAIGRSVACGADCEMTLKIKFSTNDTGWSGDIPLKECPKENVPWLVKVPSEGATAYVSVWCRVVRARSDGRILATVWPLYVLYSHLPLDTDVLIVTETVASSTSLNSSPPPLVQPAPGRGACTHLLVPGTTAARHNLSFQYREIDCPVTKEAVPLHYGVTDTSVFDKRAPAATLDDVLADTQRWLTRMGRDGESAWPYSTVAPHWPGAWEAAMLQPRCDVTVRYSAVLAGGGCSLLVSLCPAVLLCNAAPMALTLRAHDAAPLCKLEPGSAISPPSVVLKKPFFISVEMGRETFVSGELVLSTDEVGRYGRPAPGRVVLDRGTELAVQCNQKVALLTMYYEIKEDINVLGLSSMYVLINRLGRNLLVSAMAVPNETDDSMTLRPGAFKVIEPSLEEDVHGKALCNFWVVGHVWRGSDPADLRLYLCLALAGGEARAAPVRLGRPPTRRAVPLVDTNYNSLPVVVTQVKHEGRWVVTVAHDPCPQLAVHNRTNALIAVAQPVHSTDEPITSNITVMADCAGTAWHCLVPPGALMHYSTPGHCLRYPAPHNAAPHSPVTFLSFAKPFEEETDLQWCAPVAIAEGEQLVQLYTSTVKLRVRTHLHSTLLELRDVDHRDISASDIRNRLYENFSTEDISANTSYGNATKTDSIHIQSEKTDADAKLLAEPDDQSDGIVRSASQETTTTLIPNIRNLTADAQESIKVGATKAVKIPECYSSPGPGRRLASTNNLDPSTDELYIEGGNSVNAGERSSKAKSYSDESPESGKPESTTVLPDVSDSEWDETASWSACDRLRLLAASVAVELAAAPDACPLIALHLDRAVALIKSDARRTKTTISIADVQVDNLQYSSGQYDFAVVATTRNAPLPVAPLPPLWNVFGERRAFAARPRHARALLRLTHDTWTIAEQTYTQLAEVEMRVGPLALYVEDAYVVALGALCRCAAPPRASSPPLLSDERSLRTPLRLRMLTIYPLDLTLTLHTAVRMYIALDQSPLRLTAFKLDNAMTSTEHLTHALTVHYLSAAILGAGWVVGGLELLGAPGALAARVGGATGGVRGVAAAAAAALLRSLSAWAGSLARNLDLLAGDEEHARRAAAARRRAPPSLLAGLAAGITNFAINILGAVGGLAHHPLVGVAVGETESGTTALRRGLVGALTKPLSATADLVAYAGHGLLSQTGWDPVPQPRARRDSADGERSSGWRRDCVRWTFRMAEIPTLAGFHVLFDNVQRNLLITPKFLIVADPYTERIVEMVDFKSCSIGPYRGQIIELVVERRQPHEYVPRPSFDDDDEVQISAVAMARVARYTGAEAGAVGGEAPPRVVALLPAPGDALALHAALVCAAHNNSDAHFPLL